ncbi:MAG: PilZ domain-containing protein [Candidatus Omnitrophota bacterium]
MSSEKMNYEGMERRRYIRLEDVSVAYYVLEKDSPREPSFARNVSSGGISIFNREKLSPDTPLALRIALPNSKESIHVKGKVAWCSELPNVNSKSGKHYDIGIEFTHVAMNDLLLIKSHLANVKKLKDQGLL